MKIKCEYCGESYKPRVDSVCCGKEDCRKQHQKAYRKTDKYKAYLKTDKFKAYQKEYRKTDKYKAYQKAYQKKRALAWKMFKDQIKEEKSK